MSKPQAIHKRKLLLTEGKDSELFLVWACRTYRSQEDTQIMDFGGVTELRDFLAQLANQESYDEVETIVIARNAETDSQAATRSVQSAIRSVALPVPPTSFKFAGDGAPRTAFMIYPGPSYTSGTLENLCLLTVQGDPLLDCVEDFLTCAEQQGESLPRKHKNRLHSFLSGKDKYVGSTIGQASYMGAWPSNHEALLPFKEIIENM